MSKARTDNDEEVEVYEPEEGEEQPPRSVNGKQDDLDA